MPIFRKMLGPSAEVILTLGFFSPHQKKFPGESNFYLDYKKRFGDEPDYTMSPLTYLSCQIVEQAVAKAGLDRERLRSTIASTTFDTIVGPMSFKGVRASVPAMVSQIQDGEIQILWPAEYATSTYRPKPDWPKK
jgi:branched-chain amino acid transport system substrate-binding protein